MNIFTSLLERFGAKKSASSDSQWVSIAGGGDWVNERNLLEANREWVFIAVDKVAEATASVRFKVMTFNRNGEDREVFDGPLYEFLENPGEGFTGKDFIYLNTVYKELAGNAFWERVTTRQVSPLVPTRMTPVVANGKLLGFKYSDGAGQRTILAKNVLHDRYIDPAKPHWGVGKLQKIARWVDTSTYLTEFLNRFFVNGATFGGFITTQEETEQRIKLIKAGLKNDHVGVANAHKIGILPKGSDYKKVTASMSELELGDTDDRTRDKILAGFGVPKSILGLTTDVNRANAEAMEYVFAKYTVKPIVDDLIEFLNTNVAAVLDTSGRYYFAYDEFVPVNEELALKSKEIAFGKRPYKTFNEMRALEGLPPVAGGDVIPGQEEGGEPQPTPQPADEDDEDDDDQPKKALPPRARRALKTERFFDRLVEKTVEVVTAAVDPDAESHKAFVGRVSDHEKLIADKVREFNNRQEREVSLAVNRLSKKSSNKAVKESDLFDMDRDVAVMADFIGPMLKGLMLEQAVNEYLEQNFPDTFDSQEPRISKIVELAARRVAKSYNKTTAKLLARTLNEGIDAGDDIASLIERVKSVYDYSDQVRAAMVARTEAFYIANEGSREAYRQSGVVKSMRWYTAEDERVCPFCGPVHGRVIGVSEVFYPKGATIEGEDGTTMVADYRAIDVPPLHTSCRCFIRPEVISIV